MVPYPAARHKPASMRIPETNGGLERTLVSSLSRNHSEDLERQHGKSISQFGQLIVLLALLFQPGFQTFTNDYTYDPPGKILGK
jgi:hypothetical protein